MQPLHFSKILHLILLLSYPSLPKVLIFYQVIPVYIWWQCHNVPGDVIWSPLSPVHTSIVALARSDSQEGGITLVSEWRVSTEGHTAESQSGTCLAGPQLRCFGLGKSTHLGDLVVFWGFIGGHTHDSFPSVPEPTA